MVALSLPRTSPAALIPEIRASGGVLAGTGLALALVGLIGRKLASRPPEADPTGWDRALAAEHRAALELFEKLARTRKRHVARRALLLGKLKQMLDRHALEEENAVYPAMREADLAAEADELTRDHGYVRQYLYDLARMTGDAAAFKAKLASFRADIERHMRAEEQRLFPRLRRSLSEEQNGGLAEQVRREGMKLT